MGFKRISVIGLGYIGLPTAAMFASKKIHVIGVDVNERTVETINKGGVHIVEPDLDIAVKAAVQSGFLRATTQPESAEAYLIAVPTPFKGDNHEPDLSFIKAASKNVAPMLEAGNLVVLESTSPVGATEQMAGWLAKERPDLTFPQTHGEEADVQIAHCPERVLPGQVMRELVTNDRVIGGLSRKCSERATKLYKSFTRGECITTNARTAEMAKLTENSFRDLNIAFANELSIICEEENIDVWELIELANRHPRVGILQPGPGVGGHCIAVDPWFIVSKQPKNARLIKTARLVNDSKPEWVVEKVKQTCFEFSHNENIAIQDVTVACYGITFKADIDDLRESPSLRIVEQLDRELQCNKVICEPNINKLPDSISHLSLVSPESALELADVVLILVDHFQFRSLSSTSLCTKYLVDTKGVVVDQSSNFVGSKTIGKTKFSLPELQSSMQE